MMSDAITNGENVETKHRTQFGSKELTDAMFPVPKNEIKTYKICFHYYSVKEISRKTELKIMEKN